MKTGSFRNYLRLVGPAIATGVAYADPGNVATNLAAGSRFHYDLIWVVLASTAGAYLIQYLAAKLSIATGKSLPRLIGERLQKPAYRFLYWLQAEIVMIATQLAEIVGGAIALHFLFGLNPLLGAAMIGLTTYLVLMLTHTKLMRPFIGTVTALLFIAVLGFASTLFVAHIDFMEAAKGTIPRVNSRDEIYLALGIIGATIMPHAIHCHSCLVVDLQNDNLDTAKKKLLTWANLDVGISMGLAGLANIALLLVGATTLFPTESNATLEGLMSLIGRAHGSSFGGLFALGLLASSLASTAIGGYTSNSVMSGLVEYKINPYARTTLAIIPVLVLLYLIPNSTSLLIGSQVVLSFGLPMVILPLVIFTASKQTMGEMANRLLLQTASILLLGVIFSLNLLEIFWRA